MRQSCDVDGQARGRLPVQPREALLFFRFEAFPARLVAVVARLVHDVLGGILKLDIETALWAATDRRTRRDGRGSVRAWKGRTVPAIRRFRLLTLTGAEGAPVKLAFGVEPTRLGRYLWAAAAWRLSRLS